MKNLEHLKEVMKLTASGERLMQLIEMEEADPIIKEIKILNLIAKYERNPEKTLLKAIALCKKYKEHYEGNSSFNNAASASYTRMGAFCKAQNKDKEARRYYVEAYTLNSSNYAARVGLSEIYTDVAFSLVVIGATQSNHNATRASASFVCSACILNPDEERKKAKAKLYSGLNTVIKSLLEKGKLCLLLDILLERDRLGFQLSKIELLPILNEIIENITHSIRVTSLLSTDLKALFDSAMQLKLRGLASEDEINPILHTLFIMDSISAANAKRFDLARMNIVLAAHYGNMHVVSLLTEHLNAKIVKEAWTTKFLTDERELELRALKNQIKEMELTVAANDALHKVFAEKLCVLALYDKELGIEKQIEVAQRGLKWDGSLETKSTMAILLSQKAWSLFKANECQEASDLFEKALTYAKPKQLVDNYMAFGIELIRSRGDSRINSIIGTVEAHGFENISLSTALSDWSITNGRYEKALYYTLKIQNGANIERLDNVNTLIENGYGERWYQGLLERRKPIILNSQVKVDTDVVFSILKQSHYSYALKLGYFDESVVKNICDVLSTSNKLSALHIYCFPKTKILRQLGKALEKNKSLSILSFNDLIASDDWNAFVAGVEKNGVTMIYRLSSEGALKYYSTRINYALNHLKLYQQGKATCSNNRAILNAVLTLDAYSLRVLLNTHYHTVSDSGEVNMAKASEADARELQQKYTDDVVASCTRVFIKEQYIQYSLPIDITRKIIASLELSDLVDFASQVKF